MDAYYDAYPNLERLGGSSNIIKTALNNLYDSLAQPGETKSLGLDSTMSYIQKLNFSLENIEILVLFETLQVPTIGEIPRSGFVDGWSRIGNKGVPVPTDLNTQSAHIQSLLPKLAYDRGLFRRIYRHTFVIGREENQKALPLDVAKMYWDLLFGSTGYSWKSKSKNWLEIWKQFLDAKWTRTVSKDMWNQTLEFAYKSVEDDTLGFWSEDAAWPGVIDEFVLWCREKGHAAAQRGDENMDVDA